MISIDMGMLEAVVGILELEASGVVHPNGDTWASLLEHLRCGPWIQTRTGRRYPLLGARPEDVCLEDISYALAGLPRYTGHAQRGPEGHGYSIAQHSVLVSYAVPAEHALAGLVHDAPEAYVGDMSSPLKRCVPGFGLVERVSWIAIARRFGLALELPAEVKHADLVLLATEKRDLMAPEPAPWMELPEPLPERIEIWPPDYAERRFIRRFHELTNHA